MPDQARADATRQLLLRAEEFESALAACFPKTGIVLADTTAKPGAALLRLQYEALLRAAWLLYAANPNQLEKLARTLNLEAEQAAKNLPGYLDMLDALNKHAPEGLSAPLSEFNQYSRHALNSFVHGGIHPLRRAQDGFPVELAARVVVMSNGLLHFAYRVLAVLSGSKPRLDKVTHLYLE